MNKVSTINMYFYTLVYLTFLLVVNIKIVKEEICHLATTNQFLY